MEWLGKHPRPIRPGIPEDVYVSDQLADEIEAAGFRIAPRDVAARFSLEEPCADLPRTFGEAFGFHGLFHLPKLPPLPHESN